jgi:hypothetical protein
MTSPCAPIIRSLSAFREMVAIAACTPCAPAFFIIFESLSFFLVDDIDYFFLKKIAPKNF